MLRALIGGILVLDGTITLVAGASFVRWQRRHVPDWYAVMLDGLLELPEPVLRADAALEMLLGGWLLWRSARRDNG